MAENTSSGTNITKICTNILCSNSIPSNFYIVEEIEYFVDPDSIPKLLELVEQWNQIMDFIDQPRWKPYNLLHFKADYLAKQGVKIYWVCGADKANTFTNYMLNDVYNLLLVLQATDVHIHRARSYTSGYLKTF